MGTNVFDAIARRYDMANHVLSLGMDIYWRHVMAGHVRAGGDLQVLDLGAGTGDSALIVSRCPSVGQVKGVDTSEAMLRVGRAKVRRVSSWNRVKLLSGDAMALRFQDGIFNIVTAAFSLRNFPDLMKGLMEARRMLKPGGQFVVLEFSTPRWGLPKWAHWLYLKAVLPVIGGFLTGRPGAYVQLASSILAFPPAERLSRIIAQAGFEKVERYELAFGAAAVHVAYAQEIK